MNADQELAARIAAHEERRQRDRQAALYELGAACARLAEWQLSEVRLSYDGYGDHGLVEQVTARRGDECVELPVDLTKSLSELVERLLPAGWGEHPSAYGEYLLDIPNAHCGGRTTGTSSPRYSKKRLGSCRAHRT